MKTIFTNFFQVIYFCFLGFHSILTEGSICPLWRHPLPCFYLAGRVKEMFDSCAPWEQKASGFTMEAHSPTSSALHPTVSQSMTQRCHQKGGRSTWKSWRAHRERNCPISPVKSLQVFQAQSQRTARWVETEDIDLPKEDSIYCYRTTKRAGGAWGLESFSLRSVQRVLPAWEHPSPFLPYKRQRAWLQQLLLAMIATAQNLFPRWK